MWKFQNFPATQILREISFRRSRSSKKYILTPLEAMDFDFQDWKNCKLQIILQNQSSEMQKVSK